MQLNINQPRSRQRVDNTSFVLLTGFTGSYVTVTDGDVHITSNESIISKLKLPELLKQ